MPGPNTNFSDIVAFVREDQRKRDFIQIWTVLNPLWVYIKGKSHFNTAPVNAEGTKILFPNEYSGPPTTARPGNLTNNFVPITPYQGTGQTQLEFFYARYENSMYFRSDEIQLAQKAGNLKRCTDIVTQRKKQLFESFKQTVNTDFVGTQIATGVQSSSAGAGQITGQQYFLSTSNSPGNLSQTTNPLWAASVVAWNAPFDTGPIDVEIDRINRLGRGKPDFIQLSDTGTNSVWRKLCNQAAPKELLVNPKGNHAEFGFETVDYMGKDCFPDNYLGLANPGSVVVGSSDTWFINMDTEMPEQVNTGDTHLPGTTSEEYMYQWYMATANNDINRNSFITGFAA